MCRIQPPKVGQNLTRSQRQVPRQGSRFCPRFFQLKAGFTVAIQLKHDVRLPAQKWIDRPLKCRFNVLNGEAALDWIMTSRLQAPNLIVARGASANGEQPV